jgi:hypothetical protein
VHAEHSFSLASNSSALLQLAHVVVSLELANVRRVGEAPVKDGATKAFAFMYYNEKFYTTTFQSSLLIFLAVLS